MKIDFLADTNILINLLEGDKRLIPYTEKLLAISFITEIELLGKPGSDEIKEIAIQLKQKRKITLPDALIAATGLQYDLTILTFDKGFSKISGINILLLE